MIKYAAATDVQEMMRRERGKTLLCLDQCIY